MAINTHTIWANINAINYKGACLHSIEKKQKSTGIIDYAIYSHAIKCLQSPL